MGLIIALPFMFLAIMNIFAATPTGQYHLSDELLISGNIDMNGYNITNSGYIDASQYCDGAGNNCENMSESGGSEFIPKTAMWTTQSYYFYSSCYGGQYNETKGSYTIGPNGGVLRITKKLPSDGCGSGWSINLYKNDNLIYSGGGGSLVEDLFFGDVLKVEKSCNSYCNTNEDYKTGITIELWEY